MAKSKKIAMVQPSPVRPKPADLPLFAEPDLVSKLEKTLKKMGNDRAYTVLEYHQTWASVHFEGDQKPKAVTFNN